MTYNPEQAYLLPPSVREEIGTNILALEKETEGFLDNLLKEGTK